MSALQEVYNDVEQSLLTGQNENKIFTALTRIVSNAYMQVMSSDEGYCFKFSIPNSTVNRFYKDLNLDQQKINKAFMRDWGPRLTSMHQDSYYQILLLIVYYGIRHRKRYLTENALMVILMKVWNGRKHTFIKYCNKTIMNYVVNNMTSRRHEVSKHDNPVNLLKDYFVPTLLKKYESEIDRDIQKIKRLFEQCYSRVYQIFAQNPRFNPATSRNEAQGGLLPMYLKAKKEGLYMQTSAVYGSDSKPGFDEYTTQNNRERIVQRVTDAITMNPNPQYPNTIIQNINRMTKVSNRIIVQLLNSLHNHQYHDTISDILSLMLSKTNVVDEDDICNPNFEQNIKRNILKSKNNPDVRKIHQLLNSLLDDFLPKIANATFDQYSSVHQMQIRHVLTYALQYNLVKTLCR